MSLGTLALADALKTLASSGPEKKDAASGMVGASAALGGLTLVFLGVVVADYQSYRGDTMRSVRERYRKAAHTLLIAFGLSLLSVSLSIAWLITAAGDTLYVISVAAFGAQVLLIAVLAPVTIYRVLLR